MRATQWPTKLLGWLLVAAMLGGGIPSRPAWADLVPTESIVMRAPTPEWDRARLQAVLDREDVRAQLRAYGVSAEEAAARVDALTDREVALIADRLDEVPAGGNAVIGLLLLGPALLAAGLIVGIGWVVVQIVKGVANAAKRKEVREVRPTGDASQEPVSPSPTQVTTSRPQYQWRPTGSREHAIKQIFCQRRHLEFRSDWRDRLPEYRACLAE